jgi:hypothetical protein
MPSTITDRLNGLSTSTAVKSPCRVATTAAITLSGTQTIDGVAVVSCDRVLVKNQPSAIDNGIWICSAGAWTRAADFDGSFDAVGGTRISVTSGTANANSEWRTDGNGEIVIGTDSITWERATVSSGAFIDAGGPFTGSTIADDSTVEEAFQALETAVELRTTIASLAASTGAALIGWIQSGAGAVSRLVRDKLRERVSAADFGAGPSASAADNVTGLNAFFAYLVSSGAKGRMSAGTYDINAALTAVTGNNIEIEADGEGACIQYTGASTTPGDLLTFGDGTTQYYGLRLKGLTVGSTTTLTSGYGLRIKKTQYVHLDVILNGAIGQQGKLYQGGYLSNCAYIFLGNSRTYAISRNLLFTDCLEIHCQYAWVGGISGLGTGIHLGGGNGAFYSEGVQQLGHNIGLLIDTTVSANPNIQIFLDEGGTFDTNTTSAVTVNDSLGSGSVSKFIRANAWFASSGAGITVEAWSSGHIYTSSGIFKNNSGSGIYSADATARITIGAGAQLNHNTGYGVDASTAITIYSDAIPVGNTAGTYSSNVTPLNSRYGPLAVIQAPTSGWMFDATNNTTTIANGANTQVALGSGRITVANPANGDVGEYLVGGSGAVLLGSSAATWEAPTTTPAAGKASIAWNGSTGYNIYNNYGSQQVFIVAMDMKMRTGV